MSQSLAKNYIHLIFATKYRENIIKQTDLSELYAYITGILNHIDCPMICIGGTTNHVHVLCVLNKNIRHKLVVLPCQISKNKLYLRNDFVYNGRKRFVMGDGSFEIQFTHPCQPLPARPGERPRLPAGGH